MTINQAKGLRLGQRVTHILTNDKGTVVMCGAVIRIHWDNEPVSIAYPCFRMNSIHIMAN